MRYVAWLAALVGGASMLIPAVQAESRTVAALTFNSGRPLVAIVDSGIARTPELENALVAEYDTAAIPARPSFQPAADHGTMVATILTRNARRPIGIVSFRIDDPAGCPAGSTPPCQGDAAPVVEAIRQATALGVSIINISLNLKDDPAIVDAVRDAAAKGIRVVLAAGNDGLSHPGNLGAARAAFPNAVLVGALDGEGQPWKGTNLPQSGTPGYLYAWQPGVQVPTTLANGTAVTATGTSFAVPIEAASLLDSGSALAAR
ncbi:MAG TPA: S8/S53 family peptidase [Croceibacterium sp.]|nr:S8/S53 family peptidase [Croceibacterium sp.]